MRALPRGAIMMPPISPILVLVALHSLLLSPVAAVFITFENCLSSSYVDSKSPKALQFTPYYVDATFDLLPDTHWLNITIYGNVSGQQTTTGTYPPPDSPQWTNDSITFGKIADQGGSGDDVKYTTLTQRYNVLTYDAYHDSSQFCESVGNGTTCPVGPSFNASLSDPYSLSTFNVSHDFGSSYAFSTIASTILIISGDPGALTLGCISVAITPDLGSSIAALLTWLPAAILIIKGIATLSAAIWSPWGSSDIFRWSSNYGRDEDLLRLVTPGFGDCLQYIQFIVLTGSLTLQYPGFYQPAVSQASWSTLLFNQSFVNGNSTQSLQDGLYFVNATYGMTSMSQYIGMDKGSDIWACMAIWLVVIAVAVVLLCQLGFFGRWIYRMATHTTEEDLRQKNLPFTLGNMIRLLFNYFILPIVSLSLFQLVIAGHSPISVVVCAVVLLVIMVLSAGWILHVIFSTKPRTLLFDDMPTVLLFGPLYNTYNDSAAPFALIPVFITFMRAVAIGAVQPSGIAQIILLAICEVILILTLNGFRPFQGQTSMNLYHTFFSSVRLITILLMVAFVPSLGVTEAPRGWIGYIILILHACVLVFGFFLNAMQTIIEVLARSMGAGHDAQNGAIRGSVLNWRTLKRRPNRHDPTNRSSMMSSAAILRDGGISPGYGGRSRSISASSQQLLNRRTSGFENFSSANEVFSSPEIESTGGAGTMSTQDNVKPTIVAKADGADNYYRPPRPRKATLDELTGPGTKTRSTGDFPYQDSPGQVVGHVRDTSYDSAAFGSPAPAYLRARHESTDDSGNRTDYAVREVDQYYRGPALNDQPSRKLKTGPADPEGPASTAQSWIHKLVFGVTGGKKKDQSKGFEVVRSSRMQPGMQQGAPDVEGVELQQSPTMHQEPYHDSPREEAAAVAGAERSMEDPDSPPTAESGAAAASRTHAQSFDFGFGGVGEGPNSRMRPDSDTMGAIGHPVLQPISTEHRASMGLTGIPRRLSEATAESRYSSHYPEEEQDMTRYSDQPVPALDPIDLVGTIDLPSRFNSTAGNNQFESSRGLAPSNAPSRMPSSRSGGDVSTFEAGQDWLRAVDNLDWNHDRQLSTRGSDAPTVNQQTSRAPPPTLPRRSSRRASTQDPYQLRPNSYFGGFDSQPSPSPEMEWPVEQRTHTGQTQQVSHHRAADSITRNSFGANAALQASSAEYFSETPPRSRDENSSFLRD